MSDYFMTHEVKQRINSLQHLRQQTLQAEGVEEKTERFKFLKIIPQRAVQLLQTMLNTIPRKANLKDQKPAPTNC